MDTIHQDVDDDDYQEKYQEFCYVLFGFSEGNVARSFREGDRAVGLKGSEGDVVMARVRRDTLGKGLLRSHKTFGEIPVHKNIISVEEKKSKEQKKKKEVKRNYPRVPSLQA